MIDLSGDFGRRVARRLEEERIIWLTTTGSDGTPQPRPVWFLWQNESILIYSRPNTAKLRHIRVNPSVSLNLDGDGRGGDIVVIHGTASIEQGGPAADQVAAYVEKYAPGFDRLSMSAAQFAQTYTVPIRVHLEKLRGH